MSTEPMPPEPMPPEPMSPEPMPSEPMSAEPLPADAQPGAAPTDGEPGAARLLHRGAVPAPVLNIANYLTVLRLALVPVFLGLLLADGGHQTGWRLGAWGAFAAASITDRVDGYLARSRGLVTDFGKVADPIADKTLIGAAFVGLSVLGDLAWVVTAAVLAREIAVTGLRLWVIRHGVIPASRGGKVKTLLQSVAVGLYLLPLPGWLHPLSVSVMIAAVVVTYATGVDYVARALRLRRTSERATRRST